MNGYGFCMNCNLEVYLFTYRPCRIIFCSLNYGNSSVGKVDQISTIEFLLPHDLYEILHISGFHSVAAGGPLNVCYFS